MFNAVISHRKVARAGLQPSWITSGAITLLLLTIIGASPAFAQNIKYTKGATDSALRGSLEVDPSTLGLSLQVPLAEYPGRGVSLPVSLRFSSKLWRISFLDHFQTTITKTRTEGKFAEGSIAGWTTSLDIPWLETTVGYTGPYDGYGQPICTSPSCNPPPPPTEPILYINRMLLHLPDGSSHELRKDDVTAFSFGSPGVYVAVDGSRIKYDSTTATLYLPDGSRYLLNVSGGTQAQFIDRNGNTLTYTYSSKQWTDTLGRAFNTPPLQNTASVDLAYFLPGVDGNSMLCTFRWRYLHELISPYTFPGAMRVIGDYDYTYSNDPQPHSVASLFTKYLITDYVVSDGPPFNGNQWNYHDPVVLWQIVLPNNQAYTFSYNVYGEISKVAYPTGGYEEFTHATVPGLNSSLDTFVYDQANRGVASRKVSAKGDGSDVVEWTYSATDTSGYTTRANAPNGNYTERKLHIGKGSGNVRFGLDDARAGRAYDERSYSASGQLLRRTLTKWEVGGPVPAPPTGELTATRDARVTKVVEILLDTGGDALVKTTTMEYDADLNVKKTQQYAYTIVTQTMATSEPSDRLHATINAFIDTFPLGALLRAEETTFLVNDTSLPQATRDAYRARHLIALPTEQLVKNGAGTVVAAAKFSYDETAYAPLTYTGAIPGWIDPATAVRGNATTTQRWLNFDGANFLTYPSGNFIVTHAQPDQCGNVRKVWDANSKVTETFYDDAFSDSISRNSFAYPTRAESPIPDTSGYYGLNQSLKSYTTYDFQTGKVTKTKDANDKETLSTYFPANSYNRLQKVTLPDGGETSYEYGDTPGSVYVRTRVKQSAGTQLDDYVYFDGIGRAWRSGHYEGPSSWSVKDTQYDSLGRLWRVSNPYFAANLSGGLNPSGVWTTTTYDALSRVLTVTTPDGSAVSTGYSGNQVTVTDQANKQRRSVTDALGRLTQVVENPGGLNYATNYSYSTLGDLIKVEQGTQYRYFLYDSVSRLLRARNPEQNVNTNLNLTPPSDQFNGNTQWSLKYVYDANSNLTSKTDARSVTTNYGYDAINRNVWVSYTDGTPVVERHYDGSINGKGRLYYHLSYNPHPVTGAAAYSYTVINGYDAVGRPLSQSQQFLNSSGAWVSYPVARTYDLAGHVLTQTYPSNRTVTHSYGAGGRTSSFSGGLGDGVTRTYADTFGYNAAGQMTKERFGTTTTLYHNIHYNSRLQMVDTRLGTSGTDEWGWNRGALITYYSNQARSVGNPFMDATDNNGNVTMAEHYVPTDEAITTYSITLRDTYEYDGLNRLKQTNGLQRNTAGSWFSIYAQWYNYDQWGNRTIDNGATWGNAINNLAYSVSSTNNRINGVTYDAAGNVTSDPNGVSTATYDGENRMKSALRSGTQSYYVYDADGKRARRIISGVETWQVYGVEGELVAEYPVNGAVGTPQKEYGYRSGQMLIVGEGSKVQWTLPDHLGTPRMVVDKSGRLDDDPSTPSYDERLVRHDYLPFGEELGTGIGIRSASLGYGDDSTRQKFGSKERDAETGLDYFLARYYVNIQGRFTSPDEFTGGPTELFAVVAAHNPTFYADIAEPQSLNKYSYCLNNPLKFIDPNGHQSTLAHYIGGQIATGVGKAVANVFIGMNNEGNKVGRALGYEVQDTEYYQPSNELQAVVMGTTNKELALAGLLGGRTPVNVMMAEGEGAAIMAVTSRMRSAINIGMGELGEIALAKMVGGQSQVSIPTSIGRSRILDQVVTGTGGIVAHEAKVGYVKSLSEEVRTQIAKDAELVATRQVKQVVWHFFRNPTTGKIGANQKVLDALKKNGIQYEIHDGIDITK